MLTARKGMGGGQKAAEGMAQYLTESALLEPADKQAQYLVNGSADEPSHDRLRLAAHMVHDGLWSMEEGANYLLKSGAIDPTEIGLKFSVPKQDKPLLPTVQMLYENVITFHDVARDWFEKHGQKLIEERNAKPEAVERLRDQYIDRVSELLEKLIDFQSEAESQLKAEAFERLDFAIDALENPKPEPPTISAEPRRDMNHDMAHLLRIDTRRNLTDAELANLLRGRRADGKEIEGAHDKKISYIDFTFSADKSVSVAFAFAGEEERAKILQAHRAAVAEAMRFVEAEIGWALRGSAGKNGAEPGHMAWIRIDHHTSRPTLDLVNSEGATERVALKVAPDPNLHSHTIAPNHVLTESGHVGSIDAARLHGFIHVGGRYYQAVLARELNATGIDVNVDEKTGAARLSAIPEHIRQHFSKRRRDAETIARRMAKQTGRDWDNLPDAEKFELVTRSTMVGRQHKEAAAASELEEWKQQAADLGWQYEPVIRPDAPKPARMTTGQRAEIAYEAALPFLERELTKSAVVELPDLRLAATTGLVATKGVESPDEINAVINLMKARGVRQNGEMTRLIGGPDERYTTEMHVGTEQELVRLAKAAAEDKAVALSPQAIEAAIRRSGLDISSEHGEQQRKMIHALGSEGRLAVSLGVAGSGKTAALKPLTDAWNREGKKVYGASLAWRQADDLKDAGINEVWALSVLLKKAEEPMLEPNTVSGGFRIDRNAVVVVDELGLVGTADMARLLRVQERTGCKIVAIGDSLQCQSPEAGDVVGLLRRALGEDAIPKVATTIRQDEEREQTIATLFRKRKADAALAMKNEDGTLEVVPGGYEACVRRVADLWAERERIAPGKVTISAPTNEDARAIAAAIREKRRETGEVGPDMKVVKATDADGVAEYDLPLARGDRVRLSKNTTASLGNGRHGSIGRNGSVLEVVDLGDNAIKLRNTAGTEGIVKWTSLADEATGRIKLAHGDCLTIHTAQGLTSQEHIAAAPAGSRSLDATKVYVAQSRHRQKSWLVTSDGAERAEIKERRALGDETPITESDVLKNMARNLSRRETKSSALELLDAIAAAEQQTRQVPESVADGVAVRESIRLHRLKPSIRRVMKGKFMSDTGKQAADNPSTDKIYNQHKYEVHRHDAWWRQFSEKKMVPEPAEKQAQEVKQRRGIRL